LQPRRPHGVAFGLVQAEGGHELVQAVTARQGAAAFDIPYGVDG
jgi:hypothetical protein